MVELLEVTGHAGVRGEGPFMDVTLRCFGDCVARAWFESYGCPAAYVCGTWATQWAVGRSPESLEILDAEDLLKVVGGVPLGKEHCAALTVTALRDAVREWKLRVGKLDGAETPALAAAALSAG